MLKYVARVDNSSRIYRDVSFVDVPDDAVFVNQERGPISKALLLVKDTISLDYCAFEITE